jgi:uncharacterized protein YcbK (DUF882 family)
VSRISEHFRTEEFQCKGRDGCSLISPPLALILVLELLRCKAGHKPLRIVSGYRCERHNDKVGGAFASRHLEGDAVDIPAGFVRKADAVAAGATGIGLTGEWVTHVDVRPGGLTVWTY